MRELFKQYILNLYKVVPNEVYEGLLSLFCIGTIGFFVVLGFKKGWRNVASLLLIEYVFLVYCATVIYRDASEGTAGHNLSLFWSYEAIKNGRRNLVAENIMNVMGFLPIGLLIGLLVYNKLKLFRAGLFTIGSGLLISISIETLQFILRRGLFELDDILHNTIGCLIGFLFALIIGTWLLQKRY